MSLLDVAMVVVASCFPFQPLWFTSTRSLMVVKVRSASNFNFALGRAKDRVLTTQFHKALTLS